MNAVRHVPGGARVWVEDGLVFVEYPPGARIDRTLAEHTWHARKALLEAAGKPRHRVVMLGSRIGAFELGAYRFSVSRQVTDTIAAAAIVTTSAVERHLANAFTTLWKPSYPVRLFDSRDAAVAWLSTQPDE